MTTQISQEQQQAFIDTVSNMVKRIEGTFVPPHPEQDREGKQKYHMGDPTQPTVCLQTQWCVGDFVLRFFAFAVDGEVRKSLKRQPFTMVPADAESLIAEVERMTAEETLVDNWTLRQWVRALRVIADYGFTLRRCVGYPSRLPMVEFSLPDHPVSIGWLYELPADQVQRPAEINRVTH